MKVETLFILNLPDQTTDVENWEKLLKLSPLKFCKRGEKVGKSATALISPDTYWVYGIKCTSEKSAEDQIARVLEQVYSKKIEIIKLINKLGLEAKCNTYVWIDNISDLSLTFSNDLLKKMVELDISFTFTRY